jgi:hypothetical protein
MKKIENYSDLKAERIRLRQKRYQLEHDIRNNFESVKENLAPGKLIMDGVSNAFVSKDHGLIYKGVGILSDLLLKKLIFKNSGLLTRLIVPFIVKNTATNLISKNRNKVLLWLLDRILPSDRPKKNGTFYDKTTADINYH